MDAPVPDKDLTGTRLLSTFVVSFVGRLGGWAAAVSAAPLHHAEQGRLQRSSLWALTWGWAELNWIWMSSASLLVVKRKSASGVWGLCSFKEFLFLCDLEGGGGLGSCWNTWSVSTDKHSPQRITISPPNANQGLLRPLVHLFFGTHLNRMLGAEPSPQCISVLHWGTEVSYTTQRSSSGQAVEHRAEHMLALLMPQLQTRLLPFQQHVWIHSCGWEWGLVSSNKQQRYIKQLRWGWGIKPVLCATPVPRCSQGLCATQPRQALGAHCSAPCSTGQGCPNQLSISCSKAASTIPVSTGHTHVLQVPHM